MTWNAGAFDRALLQAAVDGGNARFDEDLDLVGSEAKGIVYHSTLRGGRVHPTRDQFHYAGALMDHGGAPEAKRAFRVLRQVLSAQDTDPDSRTYGIWSWFREEPLAQMSPPDWNWADFCGQAIFLTLQRHAARFPDDLRAAMESALGHAARSIERRNMGPHYTNIAFLGTFVTLAAAEYLGWEDLHAYARARLRRVAEWTDRTGTFTEFNSPTYTTVTLSVISQMLQYWQGEEAKALAERLHRRAWEHLVAHWHAPTRQWAGPHSRCYSTDLRANAHAQVMLQKATGGALALYSLESAPRAWEASRTDYHCPPDLLPQLLSLPQARQHRECFTPAERAADGRERMAVAGTTYLHPGYALGSCTRLDLWHQRRSLLLYWGDTGPARFLRLQCLHDGFDFSSAQFFSAQEQGCVLAGVNFGSDGGDTHISLDRIREGRFRARDLRLRVEIAGAPEGCETGLRFELGQPLLLDLGGIRVWLCVPAAAFGTEPVRCEVSRDGDRLFLDVVLYSGEEREIRWDEVGRAYAGLALSVDQEAPLPVAAVEGDTVDLTWAAPAGELRVCLNAAVRPVAEQQSAARALVSGAGVPAPRLSDVPILSAADEGA